MTQVNQAFAKMRSGEDYLRSLKDGRHVYADGELVKDVTTHPAFREAAKSVAHLFDVAAAPENREVMTYPSPRTGAPVWRAWQIPKSHAELAAKRRAAETWAAATFGLMGRTPDHVAGSTSITRQRDGSAISRSLSRSADTLTFSFLSTISQKFAIQCHHANRSARR